MRNGVNVFVACAALALLQAALSTASRAEPPPERPAGEDRWVPSLAITGGVLFQSMKGWSNSGTVEAGSPPEPLQGPVNGKDLLVVPFVGGAVELMTPALPIPTRPRFFLGGEITPSFSSKRALAVQGDPGCIRGPEPDAPCAADEMGERASGFAEGSANGKGTKTTAEISNLVYGANAGVAFPLRLGKRQLRIKPSVAWINYEVNAGGVVSDVRCDPDIRCTDVTLPGGFVFEGDFREYTLLASETKRFNAVGPAIDFEVDTGQFGPIGSSLFLGGRFYQVLGDRNIVYATAETYEDEVGSGMAVGAAAYKVHLRPWIVRAHVGIRFQWLGN